MEYLDRSVNFFASRYHDCAQELQSRLEQEVDTSNRLDEFKDKFKTELLARVNKSESDEQRNRYTDFEWQNREANITPYTYRFCLLLGKKHYFKKIMPHERKMAQFLMQRSFASDMVEHAFESTEFQSLLGAATNASDDKISDAVDRLWACGTKLMYSRVDELHLEHLNPYSTAVAESIAAM